MSGPRVTSGVDSQQDYKTPADFMAALARRFGPICFDLAAHAGNAQHERYFAPKEFVYTGTLDEIEALPFKPGTIFPLYENAKNTRPKLHSKTKLPLYEKRCPNVDPKAHGLDAFAHSWAALSKLWPTADGQPGLLWLNCEFDDIDPWADRCRAEAEQGARILLLTPVAITRWFEARVAGIADTIFLLGRLSFDGKHPYPKDCMVSYFSPPPEDGPRPPAEIEVWDWRADITTQRGTWEKIT